MLRAHTVFWGSLGTAEQFQIWVGLDFSKIFLVVLERAFLVLGTLYKTCFKAYAINPMQYAPHLKIERNRC